MARIAEPLTVLKRPLSALRNWHDVVGYVRGDALTRVSLDAFACGEKHALMSSHAQRVTIQHTRTPTSMRYAVASARGRASPFVLSPVSGLATDRAGASRELPAGTGAHGPVGHPLHQNPSEAIGSDLGQR